MKKKIILKLKVHENDIIGRIPTKEDLQLVNEAILALKAGAFRSAYIMIWIACAESLKRRIRVAAERDSTVGKLLGSIEDAEKKHHAVDKLLMDYALKLEFISDVEKTHLEQVFANRNLYGHPYNLAPKVEDVVSALHIAVDSVLSKQDRFGHFYVNKRLDFLLTNVSYLPDDDSRIIGYAETVAMRVDVRLHQYLFMSYVKGIEKFLNDPEKYILKRRGMVFCKAYLKYVGVNEVIPINQWHDLLAEHPAIMSWFAGFEFVFIKLDDNAKSTSVAQNIEFSGCNLERLGRLVNLNKKGLLTELQYEKVDAKLKTVQCCHLRNTGLSLDDVFKYAIERLNSSTFDIANRAAFFFFERNINEMSALSEEKQQQLGNALANAALTNAFDAIAIVAKIAEHKLSVSVAVQDGYCRTFFSDRVIDAIQRKKLCDDSIMILFGMPKGIRSEIINNFQGIVDGNVYVGEFLRSSIAADFYDAFNREKRVAEENERIGSSM